uniref:Uncharacterized protein n=1 Tax=Cyclopterus lumpus TaxID=8103 RepID=A0A8C2WKN7_CYCLU
ISMLMPCLSGYQKTPRSTAQDCNYSIRTSSLKLHISGCSFECYRELQVTSCCPGFWGPDCTGMGQVHLMESCRMHTVLQEPGLPSSQKC